MTGQDYDYDVERSASAQQPWHNRTPAVVGASILGLAAIGILVLAVSFVARQFSEPEQAPLNYVGPTFSATATTGSAAPTTTQTITSTSPPQTTDINPGPPTPSSGETSTDDAANEAAEAAEEDAERDDEETGRPTRRGPRTNVTRTFNRS